MKSLFECLQEATPDLVTFIRPHLVRARLQGSDMRATGNAADMVRQSLEAGAENDLKAAGDLSGVLKLVLFDEWPRLESAEPTIFNKKFRQDLHHVLDLRNRLGHPDQFTESSEEQRLLDYLTYSIFLTAIGADTSKRDAASSDVKERVGAFVESSKVFEEAHGALTAEQVSLREELEARSTEWAEQQQRFWTEQELAIQKQLDLLKNASEVDESARAAAEQAYQVAESQRAEYVNLLSEYRELLDESLEQGAKSRGRWSRVALVAGIFVALASVGLAAAFGFGVLAPKSPPTASVATNTASASASIPGLVSRQGDFVWVKRVQTVDCEQYVSKAGLTHLTYVVEDGDGNKLQGIFYEGAWDAGTESMMKSGKVLDLYGRVGEYKGEVSLEASQVQESE